MLMLYMSHLGEGSWAAIKSVFLSVAAGSGAEPEEGVKALRYAFQTIGFADFFVERASLNGPRASDDWRVYPTNLRVLASGRTALLGGARDPVLLQSFKEAAQSEGGAFDMQSALVECLSGHNSLSFTLPRVSGTPAVLAGVARRLELPLIVNAPDAWLEAYPPLSDTLKFAPQEELSLCRSGWEMRLCRPERRKWEAISHLPDAPMPAGTVLEWSRLWLPRRRAVLTPQRGWVRAGDREAAYLGALISRFPLLRYDVKAKSLHVPIAFPLPWPCARAAAACAGALPTCQANEYVYSDVSPRVAAVIGLLLGQPDLDSVAGKKGAMP